MASSPTALITHETYTNLAVGACPKQFADMLSRAFRFAYLKPQNIFPMKQLGVLRRKFTASLPDKKDDKGDEKKDDKEENPGSNSYWSYFFQLASMVTVASAVQFLGGYKSIKEGAKEIHKDTLILRNGVSPDDIKNSSMPPGRVLQELEEAKEYVHRTDLEEQITSILNRKKADDRYFILYGSKGCGKSTLVEKCITEKKGVVSVLVSSVFDKESILQKMSTKILGMNAPTVTEEELVAALYDAKVGGRLATVVFEVERGEGAEQTACIGNVRSLSKMFAQVCNCIIILSEANAILVFGHDRDREMYILVPDLSIDEALEYIRARNGVDVVDVKEMMHLFDNVGTNAAKLLKFVSQNVRVDEFIAAELADANQDLVAFQLKPLLLALKKHPEEGVSPVYFNNAKYEGIDLSNPVAVGAAMKGSNAVLYDMKEGHYKLISQAHKVALCTYDPIIRKQQ